MREAKSSRARRKRASATFHPRVSPPIDTRTIAKKIGSDLYIRELWIDKALDFPTLDILVEIDGKFVSCRNYARDILSHQLDD